MVTGDALKARRHAREIVAELRWCGMTVPPLYARMANEFEDLVRSGDYGAWVAANQTSALLGRRAHGAGLPGLARLLTVGAQSSCLLRRAPPCPTADEAAPQA